ncbi:hypothetical protein MPDQ_000979 [Monascus purpureus]|uniref:Uncharacterized protein n=1 Tax=Monascus purpureus TaxID=5098 RepID=A0A507QSA0_MONPU|nr:hypothetical protein MPDQ_000979 [Monascus purpureus]BDD56158.1 hypothetical protein MAP00_001635 [Monascus purpureus]
MALKSTLKSLICLPLLALAPLVRAEGFTYPVGDTIFIEGDLVNVTWDIVSPRISLYESCAEAIPLEVNITNPYSYIWNATRKNYHESGCVFEIEQLGVNGLENPPNVTSDLFGVSKRYPDDPAPTSYNFWTPTPSPSVPPSSSTPVSSSAVPSRTPVAFRG